MNSNVFSLDRFQNRNGVISWRVSGWLAGVRIRKNLKSREEAAAEKAALELRAMQYASGVRLATTFLTDGQLREAETVFRRMDGSKRPLIALVDYALGHYREADAAKPLNDCITAYLVAKNRDQERDLISARQYDSIKRDLERFSKQFSSSLKARTGRTCFPLMLMRSTFSRGLRGRRSRRTSQLRNAIMDVW